MNLHSPTLQPIPPVCTPMDLYLKRFSFNMKILGRFLDQIYATRNINETIFMSFIF